MNRDILIVAQYTQAPGEFENDRFRYLAEMIRTATPDVCVEIVTMSFSHHRKVQRTVTPEQLKVWKYDMTFIPVSSYRKNVSAKRLFSNHQMGAGLSKYLRKRKKPDVIYCAVPSLDAGYAAAKYAKKYDIPFIVDVQDIWPEAFKLAFHVPVLSSMLFYPMERKANVIYRCADQVLAVSKTYAERAMRVNAKCQKEMVVFLGTELSSFDALAESIDTDSQKPENDVYVVYVGTLGQSYDLTCVIDALSMLKTKGHSEFHLLVMGDGPQQRAFMDHSKASGIDAEFTGRQPYKEMVKRLVTCDIAVNPIQGGAAQSIINKHADYAAAGLPVINTQESAEYQELLAAYQAGITCGNGDVQDIADKLLLLGENRELRKQMGANSRRMAEELFDRGNTYAQIVSLMMGEGK